MSLVKLYFAVRFLFLVGAESKSIELLSTVNGTLDAPKPCCSLDNIGDGRRSSAGGCFPRKQCSMCIITISMAYEGEGEFIARRVQKKTEKKAAKNVDEGILSPGNLATDKSKQTVKMGSEKSPFESQLTDEEAELIDVALRSEESLGTCSSLLHLTNLVTNVQDPAGQTPYRPPKSWEAILNEKKLAVAAMGQDADSLVVAVDLLKSMHKERRMIVTSKEENSGRCDREKTMVIRNAHVERPTKPRSRRCKWTNLEDTSRKDANSDRLSEEIEVGRPQPGRRSRNTKQIPTCNVLSPASLNLSLKSANFRHRELHYSGLQSHNEAFLSTRRPFEKAQGGSAIKTYGHLDAISAYPGGGSGTAGRRTTKTQFLAERRRTSWEPRTPVWPWDLCCGSGSNRCSHAENFPFHSFPPPSSYGPLQSSSEDQENTPHGLVLFRAGFEARETIQISRVWGPFARRGGTRLEP